ERVDKKAADDAENNCPERDAPDVRVPAATRPPPTEGERDAHEDAGDDAQGVGADRQWPKVPDGLGWARDARHTVHSVTVDEEAGLLSREGGRCRRRRFGWASGPAD